MSNIKVISALALSILFSFCLSAQYTITRCSDISPRPVSYDPTTDTTKDILTVYLDGDGSGSPGEGCWVYHHRNGKDYVVISDSWHSNMTDGYRLLIEDIMQAMTDARNEYANYGSLDVSLYYLFEPGQDPSYLSFAHWLTDNRTKCWMQSELNNFGGSTREKSKFTFAHEIGHCFIMENVEDLEIEYTALNAWFDESVAEFLASEVYKNVDSEHYNSERFDLEGDEFTQPYLAYPLWYFYAKRNGKESVVDLMNTLVGLPSRTARLGHLRSIGFDMLYHEFLFEFHRKKLEDSSGNTIIPVKREIELRQDPIDLVPDSSDPLTLDPIPSERLSLFEIVIPASYEVTIYPPNPTSDKVYYALLHEPNSLKYWEEPVSIKGFCDKVRTFRIQASHLSGDPVDGVMVEYELQEREACCDEWVEAGDNPPVEELNGDFYFDYYIESEVTSSSDGSTDTVEMKYFVNSSDGSMLLLSSFFMDNFNTTESGGMKANGVIWFPNGQVVAYVADRNYGQKRAITMDMNQTRSDVKGVRAWKVDEFLRHGVGSTVAPAPLPAGSPWRDNATGHAYYQPERHDPDVRNKFTGYISNDTTFATSPLPSFGFMVGYMKDQNDLNKLMVYSRFDQPSGGYIEAKLISIEKLCASFEARGYKKMTLGGSTGAIGAMTEREREDLVASQQAYHEQLGQLISNLESCGDNENCIARVNQEILTLQRNRENAIYNLPSNPDLSGDAGTSFQRDARAVKEEMYQLHSQIIEKERQCKSLNDSNARCGGCMDRACENCREQHQQLKDDLDDLECELARLHGMGDMMDDCD